MMTALYSLLAVHWIFNIQYHEKLLELFTYIEDNVLRFPSSKKKKGAQWAAYNSTTAAIACHLTSK